MKKLLSVILIILAVDIHAQQYGMGALLDDEAYKNRPLSVPLKRGDYTNLPKSASLKIFTPTPRSQGQYGTCSAWSTAYAGRTILEALKNNWSKSKIDSNTYSPSFVYNQIRSQKGCRAGASLDDALRVLQQQGGLKFDEFGYDCDKEVTVADKSRAAGNKIIEYRDIANKYQKNQTKFVKKSLSENKPVIIAMDCPNSFQRAGELWKPDSSDYRLWSQGHGIAVIGYDDEKFGGAFELMNSWGTGWGKDGYCWIRYSDFDFFCMWAFEMIDKNVEDVQTPDLSGTLQFRESSSEEMQATYNGSYFLMDKPYESGTLFELLISNNEPAYVYAIGSDLTYKVTKLFPFSEKMVAYLPYKKNNVPIPDEDSYNMLDSTAGTSYYCFLYSKERLNIDSVMTAIENSKGEMWQRLTTALKDVMIDKNNIKFDSGGKIAFKAKSMGKSVVPILVAIKHR